MDCSKAQLLIPKYLDAELDESSTAGLGAHLRMCEQCRMEEVSLRSALELLVGWPAVEPKLGYADLRQRLDRMAGPVRRRAFFGVPSWAAAVMAVVSIGIGTILGVATKPVAPVQVPSEERVASAIDLASFDDEVFASFVYGRDDAAGEATQ